MRSTVRTLGRVLGLRHLRNERGMLLVITMVVLLVLTTLAATSLINAFIERSLAKNQNYAAIALNAADAGISAGLSWVNTDVNFATIPTASPWSWTPPTLTRTLFTDDAGVNPKPAGYATTFAFKTDAEDLDGDGNTTEVVLYNNCVGNNCFGYTDSFFTTAGSGFPVLGIRAVGTYGEGGYREVVLEVARNKFKIRANGALTASSDVNVTGNITIDGKSHDANGNLGGTCTDAFPGVNVAASKGVVAAGSAGLTGTPTPSDDSGLVSNSPDEALGICDKNGDGDCEDSGETVNVGGPLDSMLGGLPAAGASKIYGTDLAYYNREFDLNMNGTGVIIVHNPLFNPRVWKCSAKVIPDPAHPTNANLQLPNPDLVAPGAGTSNECFVWNAGTGSHDRPYYDPVIEANYQVNNFAHEQTNAYLAARRPRNMTQNGNITWKGAIIADQIQQINGNADVIGAMISLSTVSLDILGSGSARILYSCDALNLFAGMRYTTKTAWHRTR